jgi:hypothetical protein
MTLTWVDPSTSRFSRMGAPLSAPLQFSTPLVNSNIILAETAARHPPQGGEDIEVPLTVG